TSTISLHTEKPGPSMAHRARLFAAIRCGAFFTTKPQGSGIGLAISRSTSSVRTGSLCRGAGHTWEVWLVIHARPPHGRFVMQGNDAVRPIDLSGHYSDTNVRSLEDIF